MKRFTPSATVVVGVSLLAAWVIFQVTVFNASTSSIVRPSRTELFKILNAGHEVVIPLPSVDRRMIAPAFDAEGNVISDPSGMLLSAGHAGQIAIPMTGFDCMVAPVFDANGSVVSDPSGIILNAGQP